MCFAAVEFQPTLPRLYEEHKQSVVKISTVEIINDRPEYYGGSGFVVDAEKGYIFTAGHIAEGSSDLFLIADQVIILKRIKVTSELECAIVQVDPLLLKKLNLKEVNLTCEFDIGETIFIIGHPYLIDNSITTGIISKDKIKLPPNFPMDVIMTDAIVRPGSSGSPVFNLEGEVIGCAVGYMDGFGLILPAQTIINFINSLND